MQLGDPGVLVPSSGESVMAVTAAPEAAHEGDNGGDMIGMDTNSGEEDKAMIRADELGDSKINFGGNRWPRQETLALLKIRSDMDSAFRDSSLKGPLWEEVSSKMAALGYHRTAKKCKEKFENVYKYHKRTKDSRSGKPERKSYRFFDQLQALENHQFTVSNHRNPTTTTLTTTKPSDRNTTTVSYVTTVPTTNPTVIISSSPPPTNATTITSLTPINNNNPRNPSPQISVPSFSLPNMNTLFSTTSTSSSTASDEDLEERYRKKRKWKDYFRRLTRQVLAKQEEMQKRFLDAIDKRERERVAQQEAWRMQEMGRINREHEILVQERSTAAAKDAAVIAFLQKLSGQQNPTPVGSLLHHQPQPQPQVQPLMPTPQPISQVQPQRPPVAALVAPNHHFEAQKLKNGDNAAAALTPMSSSRWPKAEVHALIRLRTSLDNKYQENGPKGPLWEEISAGMHRLGYNRSAKRCKEKWENINKYFKKMKESTKQRREDSKTCPYYHELEALYNEKSKTQNLFGAAFDSLKPNEMMEPLMVQPEQQWRPPPQYDQQQQAMEEGMVGENNASELHQEKQKEIDHDGEEEDDVMEEDSVEDEEGGAGSYENVTNKLSSVGTVG
ncbi:hypothetical protein L6164_008842 [Bauhinia variegata]|uniref:Uncharacterized protein n=1 Tax=Bauhinia variegata TaxID=167791 RepID=A0ACB9PI10_BAUVA|nr:hypothetical protein L6164_008842 [Bauhinia variegata]